MTTQLDTLSTRMSKNVWIQIRIDNETKKELEAYAQAHDRTLSNYLIWAEKEYRKANSIPTVVIPKST